MSGGLLLVFIGMMVVTYIPRMLPLVLLAGAEMPRWFVRWLSHVPVAILSALLASSILFPGGRLALGPENHPLLAAVPTLLVARKTRSLLWTVVSGVLITAALRRW